jgi:hypothetical protein
MLLPTDAGEPKPLALGRIEPLWATWFPDGARLLVLGREPGHEAQLFVKGLDDREPAAITQEGFHLREAVPEIGPPAAISPDGKLVATLGPGSRLFLVSTEGGEPRELAGLGPAVPIRWLPDGQSLYVRLRRDAAGRVYRLDPWTGERELWRELLPPDPAGIARVGAIRLSADGRSYAYSYSRQLVDLFLVSGLR